jgi:hypothetical protein
MLLVNLLIDTAEEKISDNIAIETSKTENQYNKD